jgi:sugar phosphate isomerase/epimerase
MFRNLSTVGLPLSGRPSELIEMALSFGFDSMGLDLIDFQQQAKVYGVEHARRLMVSARLKVGVFTLPVSLGGDDETFAKDLAALADRLDLAQQAEATRAVVTVEAASDEHSFKDNFERYRTRLQSVGELLEPRGIVLGLAINPDPAERDAKAHRFLHTLEGLLGLVAVSHPQVGVVVDPFAMYAAGESVSMIRDIPEGKIVEVRLSDAPVGVPAGELTKAQRLLPGETGTIDMVEVIKAAEAAKFDGCVTPWAARATISGRGRERIVRLAGDRLIRAWKDAGLPEEPRWFVPVAQDDSDAEEAAAAAAAPASAEGSDE